MDLFVDELLQNYFRLLPEISLSFAAHSQILQVCYLIILLNVIYVYLDHIAIHSIEYRIEPFTRNQLDSQESYERKNHFQMLFPQGTEKFVIKMLLFFILLSYLLNNADILVRNQKNSCLFIQLTNGSYFTINLKIIRSNYLFAELSVLFITYSPGKYHSISKRYVSFSFEHQQFLWYLAFFIQYNAGRKSQRKNLLIYRFNTLIHFIFVLIQDSNKVIYYQNSQLIGLRSHINLQHFCCIDKFCQTKNQNLQLNVDIAVRNKDQKIKVQMQQMTFFNPQANKVVITKKHLAMMLFAWWIIIQMYEFIIAPSGRFLYQNLIQQKSINFYGAQRQQLNIQSKIKQNKNSFQGNQNSESTKDQNNWKQVDIKKEGKKQHRKKHNQKKQDKAKQNEKLDNKSEGENQQFQIVQQGISNKEESSSKSFKINFKIHAKNMDQKSNQIKNKLASKSLNLAIKQMLQKHKYKSGQVQGQADSL